MYYSLSQTSICSLLGHETTLSPNINQSIISQVKMIRIYSIIHLPPSLPLTQGSLEEWNTSLGRRGAIGQVKRHPHPSHWELQFLSAPVSHISLEEMQNNFPRAVSLVFCTSLNLFFFPFLPQSSLAVHNRGPPPCSSQQAIPPLAHTAALW